MKRISFAITLLGAFTGAAWAQTNVTLYGVVDVGLARQDDGNPAGKTVSVESGQHSGSRLGFQGRENLGRGLAAVFMVETGFNVDNGALDQDGRIFGRQAWVGLEGDFGAVRLGRQDTVLYTALDAIDPFQTNLAGDAQRVFGYGSYASDPFLRNDNAISYRSPSFGGLSGAVTYGLGEQPGDNSINRNVGLGVGYVNGPLNVQLAYHKAGTVAAPASFGAAVGDNRALLLGASHDFGIVTAHLAYANNRLGGIVGGGKNRNMLVGVSMPAGPAGKVIASFIRNEMTDLADGQSDQYAMGYTHKLSKRTNLYLSYSYTRNANDVALDTFNGEQFGQSVRLVNVGVRHRF